MSEINKSTASKRPLSPHLSIYKPQISSILSITHRATGFGLFVGALLLSWWVILNVYVGGECVNALNAIVYSIVGKTFMVLWTWAIFYHLLNGIRHLFWDTGRGFQIKTLNASGIAVVTASLVLTAASWLAVIYIN
jgi:succinate dehydrogenase / fumarate reductase cytochrome b subunit